MILDSSSLTPGQALQADICIIGAGAAGITIALDLIDSGLEVVLLEAGGTAAEPETQALYSGSVADPRLHSPPDRYRQRRFGGTTTIWGGRCMPFDRIDFTPRDYVAHSGWPLTFEDLLPYYPSANKLAEAGEFAYTAASAFPSSAPPRPMISGFVEDDFSTDTLERFSCPTDFGTRYQHRLSAARNIRVVLHANVTRLKVSDNGRVLDSVSLSNLGGKEATVVASQFVLATGGMEVVRLLLANRDVHSRGIGNEHDVVGRYYMCHLAGTIGALRIPNRAAQIWHGYDVSPDGVYCRRRLALTADAQRTHRLGNFIARLHHPRITDPEHGSGILSLLYLAKPIIPYEYRIRLLGPESTGWNLWFRHLNNVVRGPFDAAGFAWHMFRDRWLAERKFPSIIIKPKTNLYSLDFHAEQQPNRQSRVMLGRETDAFGMPRLNIDWRYTSDDVDTVSRSIGLFAAAIDRSGLGSFEYDPSSVEEEMVRYGAYGGHHIGTARMGTDPRTSVVNPDGLIHGMVNLFVAGAATFPTSSQANPTLTILALSLRLAAHLRSRPQVPSISIQTTPDALESEA